MSFPEVLQITGYFGNNGNVPIDAAAGPASGNRWDRPGVPHEGWSVVGMDDLEDEGGHCEMCGEAIRYAHLMSHPTYPDQLEVGSTCAHKMSDCALADLQREKRVLQARVGRRLKWSKDPEAWRPSPKRGNLVRRDGKRVLAIVRAKSVAGYFYQLDGTFSGSVYADITTAMFAAYDVLHPPKIRTSK